MDTDVLDGLGSTEMLHIFLTNRQGDVRPNSSGKAVPGYELRLVDDGAPVPDGELGHLEVAGSTSAICIGTSAKEAARPSKEAGPDWR